jgi:hypothetical protein
MLESLRFLVNWRLVIYGLIYVLIMRFRPEGIMGYKEFSIKGTIKGTIRFFRELPEKWVALKEKIANGRRKQS